VLWFQWPTSSGRTLLDSAGLGGGLRFTGEKRRRRGSWVVGWLAALACGLRSLAVRIGHPRLIRSRGFTLLNKQKVLSSGQSPVL
jgi:hypothetical protein